MRLNKYLALKTDLSRREADKAIDGGRVIVNGEKPTMGHQVEDSDKVLLDGKPVLGKKFVYLAFNKPKGIVTSGAHCGQTEILDILKYKGSVHPVGRLDKDSHGLVILTNDPRLTIKLLSPSAKIEKEYVATTDFSLTGEFLKIMKEGVNILVEDKKGVLRNYKTKPAKIKKLGAKKFGIILTEGKKRQIRLMCKALGYSVMDLERIRVGKVRLEDVGTGRYRELTSEDF